MILVYIRLPVLRTYVDIITYTVLNYSSPYYRFIISYNIYLRLKYSVYDFDHIFFSRDRTKHQVNQPSIIIYNILLLAKFTYKLLTIASFFFFTDQIIF